MTTPQQRAAKTRAYNRETRKLYEEISKPAHENVDKLLNCFLQGSDIRLKWVGGRRLKNGAIGARLVKIDLGGLRFMVHIDGYKTVKHYSSRFWEVV